MSISIIPLNRAAVTLEVDGAPVDISAGVRAALLAVAAEPAAYYTLESGWARQMDGGRRGALLLTVPVDSDDESAYAHLRDWLLAGGARGLTLTQADVIYSGDFRLRDLSPLADAQAGAGSPALANARLALDGPLSVT